MPWGDGTGPWGLGPMTGRAAGYCAGYPVPGYMNPIPGFGRRIGRGFGRGFWHWGRGRGFWWRGYYPYPVFYRGVAPVYYPKRYLTSDSIYPKNIYPEPTKEEEKAYLQDLLKSLEEELKAVRERLQELSKEKGESQ